MAFSSSSALASLCKSTFRSVIGPKSPRTSTMCSHILLAAKADLSPYFPIFLWVLRDFHLALSDDQGESISEKEYLERALRLVPGQEALEKVEREVENR